MSKHEKALKRERQKAERTRRQAARFRHPTSHTRHGGAAALAAAAAIAAGTSAYAAPIRFDNPAGAGHFDWAEAPGLRNALDMVLPAESQPGGDLGPQSSILQVISNYGYSYVGRGGAAGVETDGAYYLLGHASGTLIPSGSPWLNYGYNVGYYGGTFIAEGTPTYLGVRFDLGSGYQYGWIGVERSGTALDAFAWGYETEPGVGIPAGAPEPGTLALLAMGAVGVLRRRR